MATLQENIGKVIAAADNLKAGLSEKGISVPSDIKLGDLVDLAKSSIGEYVNSVNFSNAPATVSLTSNIIRSDLSKAESLRFMFSDNDALESISLPTGCGAEAKNIEYAFANCMHLTSLSIPEEFGQNAEIANGCFLGSGLQSITLPAKFGQKATNMQSMFSGCTSLKSIDFGSNSQFGASVATTTNVNYCFGRLSALESITGAIKIPVSFSLAECPNLTHDSLMNVVNKLATVTTEQTLTLGSANLSKLSEEEQQIAKDKGWKLA